MTTLQSPAAASLQSKLPLSLPPSSKKSGRATPPAVHLLSGAISGATSVVILQPLDLVKTRVQQESRIDPIASTSKLPSSSTKHPATLLSERQSVGRTAKAVAKRNRPRIWTTANLVIQKDGVRGLWRGTVPTLYRNVPGVSLYFLSLAKLRTILGASGYFAPTRSILAPVSVSTNAKIKLSTTGDLLVGSTARTGVGFLLMPATLLKTLSESSLLTAATPTTARPSSFSLLSGVYNKGGLPALWRGSVPTALRDAPGAGLFIVFYERTKTFLGERRAMSDGGAGAGAVGGGAAGAIASLFSTMLTTPFDLLKTRRQLSPAAYPTLRLSILRVYRTAGGGTSGVRAFWQGASLRVARKAGSAGVGWAVYEAFLGAWERRGEGRD